ncbi:hypothetical protein DMN91_005167 [Ooceraea biroi]|uniref:Uncharacterized protein n=2 Tax=Ooceraea biroi TaxID=2015173 RepID=A0A3L8DSN8_OOCBI|nr:hypothetical protein DMN91_005167 [Ooceraea biroi]
MQAAEAAEKLWKEREIFERKRQREEKMKEWTNLMEKLKQEEEERLSILAEPLQRYLAKHVLPTLTEALIEVARLRPDDPVDFLAEYLFKKNPEGKMFEPDYTETMSMLLDAIGQQQSDVLPEAGLDSDIMQFLKKRDELSTADEIEENGTKDERGTPTLIPEQTTDCESTDEFEREESNFTERISDEFGREA